MQSNAPQTPEANASLPITPTEYFAYYPEGLWDLGSTLKPVRRIVHAIMEREAIEYEQAIHYLIGEYFVTPYEKYVEKYLRQGKETPFDLWCRIEFTYRVRRGYAYNAKRYKIACERMGVPRGLDDIPPGETHGRLQTPGDQLARAVELEREAERLGLGQRVLDILKGLEPIESYVVWNHSALEHNYDSIARSLGISPTTAKKIYVGVVERLRREAVE